MSDSKQAPNTLNNSNSKQNQTNKEPNQKFTISISLPNSKESNFLLNSSLPINKHIFDFILNIVRENGLSGTRFYNEFIQELGKTIVSIFYLLLSDEYKEKYKKYIEEYIPNPKMQLLKTPVQEFRDERFLSQLKGKELSFMRLFYDKDMTFKTVIFISNEKLPNNFFFAPEMDAPIGWTSIDDFTMISSLYFLNKKNDILTDIKLPFSSMNNSIRPSIEWFRNRYQLIIRESSQFLPDDFSVFETCNSKKVFKKFSSIPKFESLNRNFIFHSKMTIGDQKKLLRIFYLYGIPKQRGIMKIRAILRNKIIDSESIISFSKKILIKSIKYKPLLYELLQIFPEKVNLNENQHINIDWIDERAIESIATNLELLYKIRENYEFVIKNDKDNDLFEKIDLPEWTEMLNEIPYWGIKQDKALFKIAAYYGFLFNSMLAKFIRFNELNTNEILKWRDEESLKLTPICKDISKGLFPVFQFERKVKRLTQIVDHIQKFRNQNK